MNNGPLKYHLAVIKRETNAMRALAKKLAAANKRMAYRLPLPIPTRANSLKLHARVQAMKNANESRNNAINNMVKASRENVKRSAKKLRCFGKMCW
jgi:hypothetical protein